MPIFSHPISSAVCRADMVDYSCRHQLFRIAMLALHAPACGVVQPCKPYDPDTEPYTLSHAPFAMGQACWQLSGFVKILQSGQQDACSMFKGDRLSWRYCKDCCSGIAN